MNCPNCNSIVEPGSAFCANCGARFDQQPVNNGVANNAFNNQPAAVNNVSAAPEMLNSAPNNQFNTVSVAQPDVQVQNSSFNQGVSNVGTGQNINQQQMFNQSVPTNNQVSAPQMNMNSGSVAVGPGVKSNNTAVIVIVAVIAIVAVAICYFMVSGNNKKLDGTNDSNAVASTDSSVTINGMTGTVPKGWSFVSGVELGSSSFDSAFVKDTQDSVSGISASPYTQVTLDSIIANAYKIKANFESGGLTDVSFKDGEKNGKKYALFNCIYNGSNYHILYTESASAGVIGAEGYYASADDLDTIVNFVTGLKESTGVKSSVASTLPNFAGSALQK